VASGCCLTASRQTSELRLQPCDTVSGGVRAEMAHACRGVLLMQCSVIQAGSQSLPRFEIEVVWDARQSWTPRVMCNCQVLQHRNSIAARCDRQGGSLHTKFR
jgi:hypothetical protein